MMLNIKGIFASLQCNASTPVAKPAAALRREEEEIGVTDRRVPLSAAASPSHGRSKEQQPFDWKWTAVIRWTK